MLHHEPGQGTGKGTEHRRSSCGELHELRYTSPGKWSQGVCDKAEMVFLANTVGSTLGTPALLTVWQDSVQISAGSNTILIFRSALGHAEPYFVC